MSPDINPETGVTEVEVEISTTRRAILDVLQGSPQFRKITAERTLAPFVRDSELGNKQPEYDRFVLDKKSGGTYVVDLYSTQTRMIYIEDWDYEGRFIGAVEVDTVEIPSYYNDYAASQKQYGLYRPRRVKEFIHRFKKELA